MDSDRDAPEIISTDPDTAGWLLKIQVADPSELEGTCSATEYRVKVEGASGMR